jgi:hypothetical protein
MGKVGSFDGKEQSYAGVHFRGQKIINLVRRFVFKFCKNFTKSHKRGNKKYCNSELQEQYSARGPYPRQSPRPVRADALLQRGLGVH